MVQSRPTPPRSQGRLSVLALSSRFDGRLANHRLHLFFSRLSVLALSSRFDGHAFLAIASLGLGHFQYSLCRVVLMVPSPRQEPTSDPSFQYSLCRVVLMVSICTGRLSRSSVRFQYSLCRVVLMVSIQMDGFLRCFGFQYSLCRVVLMVPCIEEALKQAIQAFSTRSVESF